MNYSVASWLKLYKPQGCGQYNKEGGIPYILFTFFPSYYLNYKEMIYGCHKKKTR